MSSKEDIKNRLENTSREELMQLVINSARKLAETQRENAKQAEEIEILKTRLESQQQ